MFTTPVGWLLDQSGIPFAPPAGPLPLAAGVIVFVVFVATMLALLVVACRAAGQMDDAVRRPLRRDGWLRHPARHRDERRPRRLITRFEVSGERRSSSIWWPSFWARSRRTI